MACSLLWLAAPRPAQANLVDFVCYLTGDQVPTTSTAVGTGRFTLDTNANTLSYEIRYGGLSTPETVSHIHGPAQVGVNAAPVHTLPLGRVKTGVWNYSEPEEANILSGRTYVNIHSSQFPGGEIRGQIVSFVSPMDGAQTGAAATAKGMGYYLINTDDNVVTYTITISGLSSPETGAHIHGFESFGIDGGIVHTLPSGTPKTGAWNYSEADEESILLGLAYANVHTDAYPAGEIRGQITRIITTLDGDQAGITTDAVGTGLFAINTPSDQLSYYVTFSGLSSAETGAHIHGYAPPGTSAGILHTLPAGSPKLGLWSYPAGDENNILDGLTYVNIHSSTHTAGEIRGQIQQGGSVPPTRVDEWWLLTPR